MKPKKRNPTDATIRNTQAANKKIAKHEAEIKELKKQIKVIKRDLAAAISELETLI